MLGHCTIVYLDPSPHRASIITYHSFTRSFHYTRSRATRPFSFNVCAGLGNEYSGRIKVVSSQYKSARIGKDRPWAMKQQLVKELKLQDYGSSNMISHITRERKEGI